MKAKIAGVAILVAVILLAVGYKIYSGNQKPQITLTGYIGSEKAGLFDDPQIKDLLKTNYGITVNYSTAGSFDMITADQSNRDFLFPSNEVAYDLYKQTYNKSPQNKVIFSSPLVLYTHSVVLDALKAQGIVSVQNGVNFCDMQKLTNLIVSGKKWKDIGLPDLFGNVCVYSTDPEQSNSGNMYACLLASVLNGGSVVDQNSVDKVMPQLKTIFTNLGYMESSSGVLFNDFLTTGVGSKPIMIGYENQLLEFAANPDNQSTWQQIKGDIKIIYPTPTMWANHTYIALDKNGSLGITALMDSKIQALAWQNHGFRTISNTDIDGFQKVHGNLGLLKEVTQVVPLPNADTINKILAGLKQ
jgi:hypothetical protein